MFERLAEVRARLRRTRESARYPAELLESDIYLMGGAGGVMPPEFRPRLDLPSWRLELPLEWAANPFGDRNWRFHLNVWRMTDPLIRRWYRDRDPALLRDAFMYASDWWRYHQAGGKTPVSWNDMASGIRALKLAFFLERRRLGDFEPTRDEASQLLALVDAHARFLARPEKVKTNNHSLIQAIGYRQLCRQAPDRKACKGADEQSAAYLRRILAHQFTEEGIHREHSPGYHFFVTDLLADLRVAELFTDVEDVADIARRAHANRGWFVFPNREVARIGDHAPSGDPLDVASRTHVIDGREIAVGDFSRSGYAIVRTLGSQGSERQSMLIMTAMYHDVIHKHADDLSFELFEAGQRIFIDSGRYDFEWSPMRRYVYSAAAHNTVDLADAPITHEDTEPYGSGLSPIRIEDDELVLSGRVGRARKFDHARTLRYRPGVSLLIEDVLESDVELPYVGRLHFASNLTVAPDGHRYTVIRGDQKLAIVEPPPGATIRLIRGQKDPLLGWDTIARREMAPTYVLEALLPGRNERMTWRVALFR